MVQRPHRRRLQNTRSGNISRCILRVNEPTTIKRPAQNRNSTRCNRFFKLCDECLCFRSLNDWPKIKFRKFIARIGNSARVTKLQRRNNRHIHFEKLRQQSTLNYIARVGGAALLAVGESFFQMPSKHRPLRKIPYTPGV